MDCLSPEAVARYVAGGTADPELLGHVDGCEACRRTVAAAVRAGRASPIAHDDIVAIGSTIDRYQVRAVLGHGAMGHVYEAHDPELDRAVAVKVVRHRDEANDARAVREGRALARLAHPNIVSVHDVGRFAGGVFLAMELVRGDTVRAWAERERPPLRRIVEVFVDVARGLAAAHAAGLVHRDVKPDNLVVGADGRVRVIDFGLAVGEGATSGPAGTPRYMAPELSRDRSARADADARSDQYAFAASLREVLDVAGARVPAWLRAVLARATDDAPARRYPDVDRLAAALARGLGRRRRFVAIGAFAAVAATATVVGATTLGGSTQEAPSACRTGAARAQAAWSPQAHATLSARFAGATGGVPLADVTAVLDAYASTWATAYQASCDADASAPTPAGQQRLLCLDGHLRQLDAVVALARDPDVQPVSIAAAALGLPPPPDCTDAVTALVPTGLGPSTRASIEAIREQVSQAHTLDAIGRGDDALAKMRAAAGSAQRLAVPALEVEVLIALGELEVSDGIAAAGETTLRAALAKAHAIADRTGEADAAILLGAALVLRGKLADAERAIADAERLVAAAGNGARLRLQLLEVRSEIEALHGDAAKVHAVAEQERALATELYGPDDRRVVTAMIGLAASTIAQDPAASRAQLDKARELASRLVGRSHPLLAEIERARCLAERADPAKARPACEAARDFFAAGGAAYRVPLAKTQLAMSVYDKEHAVELVTAARDGFPPGSVFRALADSQLAAVHRRSMNHAAAVGAAQDAVKSLEAAFDRDAVPVINELTHLGRDLMLLGRGAEAAAALERVATWQDKAGVPVTARVDILLQLAGAQFYAQRQADARATIARAMTLAETTQGPDSLAVGEALFSTIAFLIEREDVDEATAILARARTLLGERKAPSLRARLDIADEELHRFRGDIPGARRALTRATAEAAESGTPFVVFMARLADCEVLTEENAWVRALAACTDLLGVAETAFGRDSAAILEILAPLAEAQLARGKRDDALASIDRALALAEAAHDQHRIAVTRFAKARILDGRGERGAARALAELAAADVDHAGAVTTTRIRAWLAKHP